jgi:hypothetical protein
MKRIWKDILLTLLTLIGGVILGLIWVYEESLVLKIYNTIALTVLPIVNTVIYNK